MLQYSSHVRNFSVDEPEIDAEMNAALAFAFNEDKVILERIQKEEERNPNAERVMLGIDAAPTRMARMVQKMIEEEKCSDEATAAREAGAATGRSAEGTT